MKLALIASEVNPLAKTGGLADVTGSLPRELAQLGQNVCVFMPYYKMVNEQNINIGN